MAQAAEGGVLAEVEGYARSEYMQTAQGTLFGTGTDTLLGGHNITLGGKTILLADVVVHGELAKVKVGRQCVVGKGCVIRPASRMGKDGIGHLPLQIGSHTMIGDKTTVEALRIGSHVSIGSNCTIGKRTVVGDCSMIEDGTVLPDDCIVAPFTRWTGTPARMVGELGEGFEVLMQQVTRDFYERFRPLD